MFTVQLVHRDQKVKRANQEMQENRYCFNQKWMSVQFHKIAGVDFEGTSRLARDNGSARAGR